MAGVPVAGLLAELSCLRPRSVPWEEQLKTAFGIQSPKHREPTQANRALRDHWRLFGAYGALLGCPNSLRTLQAFHSSDFPAAPSVHRIPIIVCQAEAEDMSY